MAGTGLLLAAAMVAACGGDGRTEEEAPATAGALTTAQLERGVGPIEHVELGPLDDQLAAEGEAVFAMKCSACHRLDERYVGPPLREVLERRTPEYVMNMMLNPAEMLERHPTARQLLAEYYTPMPFQDVSTDEARALLEYLRRESEAVPPDTNQTGETP